MNFQNMKGENFILKKLINNVPFIFVFDDNLLKIFEFYSGNLFKTVKFELSLNLSNIISWDNEHIIICDDDWVWMKSGDSFIYNITSNIISPIHYNGYNFNKYEFENTKYIYYNSDQKCIKALKEGKPQKNFFEEKKFPSSILIVIILIISLFLYKWMNKNNN